MNISERPSLKIIPIGGTTTVQKNMYVYECGNDILVMDCGIGFPDMETPGVDVTIPDFTYVLENRHKVRGVVITHGHEDHRGSLPYLLQEHKFDVYAVPFVKALIEKSLEEYTSLGDYKVKPFDPNQSFQLGCFRLTPFRVNHSIPDTLGFAIDTPQGRVFHNSDFKFDWSPVMDKPFDVQKAARLAGEPPEGVLALLSDCLGSTSEGFTESESKIQETFETVLKDSVGKQVFITTISSNISRIQQAINAAEKFGRKVVLSGRSIRNTIEIAQQMGYIKEAKNTIIDESDAHKHNQETLVYVITGCYGQKEAGLWRVALGEHKNIVLSEKSVVIFSADPIPNSVATVNALIDELYLKGVDVYYSEIQDDLHVSGHGGQGDMVLLANLVRPKYFIPIGGSIKHMRAYANLIDSHGFDKRNVAQLLDGQSIVFKDGKAQLGDRLKLKEVYVDGNLVGDVGASVLKDRIQMANHGMVAVVIQGQNIELITRGFVFIKGSKKLLESAKNTIRKSLSEKKDIRKIENKLQQFLYKETGREPIVVVTIANGKTTSP
ncbi:hypothetical protein CO058_03010 [candidate division WWE3 bacterium CG_4_9_14_0_2_um_filter_35_11]|uniref:Metallo-beta-lactamase domain-containing protein n=1 Tax=candidate division WWE3 bacterium CG_4_9_14_0_2_um_filter_35_11 TaxID=1975077 RepID=A0A2M8ELD7_UNCKA|nr:MAG: hypothetical protein COV25_01940 [candidate division WWE3 bacterium CG10_big_fil_rev_8_21_14_0_10_35_32]PJC23552.1 MAG: hypothetical protein CO058_03010 [candidate division WWE3 bacterium CG_4_9_14_0_2_um_filter_35_11]